MQLTITLQAMVSSLAVKGLRSQLNGVDIGGQMYCSGCWWMVLCLEGVVVASYCYY